VNGNESLFVDDNIGHVDRASAAGFLTHHYTDREGFMTKLRELRLV
jgi:hypothetical protein